MKKHTKVRTLTKEEWEWLEGQWAVAQLMERIFNDPEYSKEAHRLVNKWMEKQRGKRKRKIHRRRRVRVP